MTEPHYADERAVIYHGDCRAILAELTDGDDGWADAIVCDPPYELKFMGKGWDGLGVAFDPETWKRCYEVLKPGGYLLAFGGSRTWHRMAVAIEDAGFEMRDSIAWLYGSGFPKSMDVSKAIDKAAGATREVVNVGSPVKRMIPGADQNKTGSWIKDNGREFVPTETAPATEDAQQWAGWGTALKPAFEPIVVARKPLGEKTVAANVLTHGTGAINIDACRVQMSDRDREVIDNMGGFGSAGWDNSGSIGTGVLKGRNDGGLASTGAKAHDAGRWPTNVVLDGDMADALDEQTGTLTSGANPTRRSSDKIRDAYGEFAGQTECVAHRGADSGGASRFFPVFRYQAKAPAKERPKVDGVAHPTVKPLELMRWLVRLVTPPGGTIIDPFAGSGTTVEAALAEGVQVVGIEYTADYLPLIQARIDRATT